MSRYFIAPKGYVTPRQFKEREIPTLYLMPEGNLVASDYADTKYTLEIVAHIAAKHCDFLPDGFAFRTDFTSAEYPPELLETIEAALEAIALAIADHCPTVYPTQEE